MVGTFCALDLVLFYLFFEGGLIPMFLIIGVWGGPRRVYASFRVLSLYLRRLGADAARHHGDVLTGRRRPTLPTLLHHAFRAHPADLGVFAFLASFAVEAASGRSAPGCPTRTSRHRPRLFILAAVLLKLGGCGSSLRCRCSAASVDFAPLIYALSVVAIIYTSLVALVQDDMRRLIASRRWRTSASSPWGCSR